MLTKLNTKNKTRRAEGYSVNEYMKNAKCCLESFKWVDCFVKEGPRIQPENCKARSM